MTWLVGAALAAGTAVHAPGTEAAPEVALDAVSESADVQPLDPEGEPHQVRARLLLDRAEVRPGETVRLGVHLEQKTDWHTYWVSPGEVGKPTVIDWTVPDGSSVGERIHPAPAWFELSGIISYGYEDQVLHHVDVTLPDDISGEVTFGAAADWLVCEIQCIPGEAELTLTVPVATDGQVQPTPWVALFDHAEGTFPTPMLDIDAFSIESAVSTSAVRPDDEFQVAIRLAPTGKEFELVEEHGHWPMFTPIASPGWMMMDKSVTVNDDGSVLVLLDGYALENEDGSLPTDQVAGALFQVQVDGEWIRAEYRTPIEFVAADTEVLASTSPLFGDGTAALTPTEGPAVEPANVETPKPFSVLDTLPYLGLAFLGGILLNIMPCVLPVITLKLYGLVEQAHITSEERRKAGTFYTLGIMASFGALAAVIVVLQQVMDFQAGWGFQFQYPPYVIGLATIVFAFGLSLFGVFEIPAFGEDSMAQASDKEGAMGYFLTGAFATLLATPCSAPFLGTGMGFAFSLPWPMLILFFLVAGFGLAFPFFLVTFIPALYRFMPQPGAWMETAKQFLGFTLMATTVWLVDVLAAQTGTDGAFGMLVFLTVVALGAWIFGTWGGLAATRRSQFLAAMFAILLMVGAGWKFLITETQASEDCDDGSIVASSELDFSEEVPWQPFSEDRIAQLDGTPVFVDFTAEWCLTCKVNEKNVLATQTVRDSMKANGVVPLKADWTNRDDTITEWLKRYGKAGVPFYLVIPADRSKEAIALPEVITPDIVTESLDAAS